MRPGTIAVVVFTTGYGFGWALRGWPGEPFASFLGLGFSVAAFVAVAWGAYLSSDREERRRERVLLESGWRRGNDGLWRTDAFGGSYRTENAYARHRRDRTGRFG